VRTGVRPAATQQPAGGGPWRGCSRSPRSDQASRRQDRL